MSGKEILEQYCADVESGAIVTCEYVKQAVQRHRRDLENPEIWFDWDRLGEFLQFCSLCRHYKGKWAGNPFEPSPWQVFVAGSILCWRRKEDNLRRFGVAYIEVPRKNGKSYFAAVLGLFLFTMDGEGGPEVCCAATTMKQARIVYKDAKQIVSKSSALYKDIEALEMELRNHKNDGIYYPIGGDSKSQDGLNIHCAIVDEFHAHPDRRLWGVLETATGAREQPLMLPITTAGTNLNGPCMERHRYCANILDPKNPTEDDACFAFISTIDEGDDWKDPATWEKANPNWNVSIFPKDMERLAKQAISMTGEENNFKTKRLNIWCEVETTWLNMESWDKAESTPFEIDGRDWYCGLDLASTDDLCAFVAVSPQDEDPETLDVLCRFYCPRDNAEVRESRHKVPYIRWGNEGHVQLTPGNTVDYGYIRKDINDMADRCNLIIGFDRWNSGQLITQLTEDDDIDCRRFGQGFQSMSAPSKALEVLIKRGKVNHQGHPVLRWCCANTVTSMDPAENIKPDKKKSQDKIDGCVALIMAIGMKDLYFNENKGEASILII